jgi:hypothetical protein
MRKSRFTEEPVFAILNEGEAGVPVADLLRHHSMRPGSNRRPCAWQGTEPRSARKI